MARKTPYKVPNIVLEETSNAEDIDRVDTIETLDNIATLQPGKNALKKKNNFNQVTLARFVKNSLMMKKLGIIIT